MSYCISDPLVVSVIIMHTDRENKTELESLVTEWDH